jgi:hypothetical protein
MAKQTGISDAAAELKEFNKEAASLVSALQDVAKSIGQNAKEAAKITGESASAYTESSKEAVDLAKELQGYTTDQLKNKKEEAKFQNLLAKSQQNQARITSRIATLEEKRLTASKDELKYIDRAVKGLQSQSENIESSLDSAGKLQKTFEKISKETKLFDDLADFTKDIPLVSKVFGEFQKAADAARDASVEGENAFKAGAKELAGAAKKAATAFAMATIVKGVKDIDERAASISKEFGTTRDESEQLVKNFNSIGRSLRGVTGAEAQASAIGLADNLGLSVTATQNLGAELSLQQKFLGATAEESAKLATFTEATGQNIQEVRANLQGEVKLFNAANKSAINQKIIFKEVAGASAAIKLSTQGIGGNLTKAALEAKKVGLSLDKVDGIASSLLNFEESISAELEAELLTGQDLNLEKARLFALNNDIEGLTREIANQGITTEKFSKMNRLQQDAIAKSLGMQREDLAASLLESQALSNLGAKDKTELDEKVKLELQRIEELKKQGKLGEAAAARQELTKKLGDDTLTQQIEARSLAEKQAEATQQLAEAMDVFATILKPISVTLNFIVDNAREFARILAIIAGAGILGKLGKLVTMMRGLGTSMAAAGTAAGGIKGAVTQAATAATGGGAAAAAGKVAQAATAAGGGAAAAAGGAAKAASAAGAAGASGAASAAGAAGGGGGFFKNLLGKGKDLLGKFNPIESLKATVKSAGGAKGFFKTVLKKIPGLNTLLTGFFAYQDIANLVANPIDPETGKALSKEEINQKVGKIVAGGLGAILGGAIGTAVGGPIGTLVGSLGGEWLLKNLIGAFPDAAGALGSAITPLFGSSGGGEKETALATGGIVTQPTRALVGEAGAEAVIPLDRLMSEFREMRAILTQIANREGTVYLDGTKVGTAMAMSTYKTQ